MVLSNSICQGSLLAFALFLLLLLFLFFRSILFLMFLIFLNRIDRLLGLFDLHRAASLFLDKLTEILKAFVNLSGNVSDGLVLLSKLFIHLLRNLFNNLALLCESFLVSLTLLLELAVNVFVTLVDLPHDFLSLLMHLSMLLSHITESLFSLLLRVDDHAAQVVLEDLVLGSVNLFELLDSELQLVLLLFKLSAHVLDVLFSVSGHLLDGSFPLVTIVIVGIIWHDQEQELLAILFVVALRHGGNQIRQKIQFRLDGVHVAIFNDTLKCVAHDGDKHVQHSQLREESCQNEENEAHGSLGFVCKVVHVEFTES